MSHLQRLFPTLYKLYLKIAEPRTVRLLYFGIYMVMLVAGISVLFHPPRSMEGVLGAALVLVFGLSVTLGSVCAAVSVLPGIWFLERAGVIAIWTGLGLYTLTMFAIHASAVAIAIPIGFILTLVLRWREIKRYQLAPIRQG